jgi:hypothetical protein
MTHDLRAAEIGLENEAPLDTSAFQTQRFRNPSLTAVRHVMDDLALAARHGPIVIPAKYWLQQR